MPNKGVTIIAEAGVNHNGSLSLALELIDAAAAAKVDVVKFQSFVAAKLVSRQAPKADYQQQTTGVSESQLEMIQKLELDAKAHSVLVEHCAKRGIAFLSTPFDLESLDLLVGTLAMPLLKIPSGEITNAQLLLKIALTGKPVILSTGMSTLAEIEAALGVLAFGYSQSQERPGVVAFEQAYCLPEGQLLLQQKVSLLHCTTEYPAAFEDVNLRAMDTLRAAFGLKVGLSDHTSGIAVPIAAVACGAEIIEKHFTLDRNLPGPDHKASLEPSELKAMVEAIRQVEAALGSRLKIPTPAEAKNKPVARKSLVAAQSIKKGEKFTERNLTAKRPGTGISPLYYWDWLGKTAERNYEQDERVGL
jgi:N-acetylneuraminate synthase